MPAPNEALVRTKAVGLNFGEVNAGIFDLPDGVVPGWDSAGLLSGQPQMGLARLPARSS